MDNISRTFITAGGKITCLRCTAQSKRTKLQCGRPALKSSKTQKCEYHGGRSTGPKTVEGKSSISRAHFLHGNETIQKRVERQKKALLFAQIEDALHVLNSHTGGRMRGPKPTGYKPIKTTEDVMQWIFDNSSNNNQGFPDKGQKE